MSATGRNIRWGVGLFVLIAIAAGGSLLSVRLYQEYWADRPWRVNLSMDHGFGLAAGNPVKLNGVPVGSIESVGLAADGRVTAVLAVKRRYRNFLTDTARINIQQPLFLGDTWVEIVTGDPGGRRLEQDETIRIAAPEQTMEALGITKERVTAMLDTFQQLLTDTGAIVGDVRQGKGNLGEFVKDSRLYEEFTRAINQANSVMEKSQRPDTSVGRLLSEDALYTEITGLTKELRDTLSSIRTEEESAKSAVRRLDALLADASRAVREIEQVAHNVNEGKGTMGKFATDEKVYAETQRILTQLRETLEDLREQTPISTFMGALFSAF